VSGLSIKDGAEVERGGRRFIIMQFIGFDFVVARNIETAELVRLAVVDLNPVSPAPSSVPALPDLTEVDDRELGRRDAARHDGTEVDAVGAGENYAARSQLST
jgi:hypothetical protein